jgi:hypothetical protein
VAPQAGEQTHRRMLLDPSAKRVASRRLPGLLHRSEHPTSDRLRHRPAGKFDQIEISRSRVSFGASRAAMRSVQFWPHTAVDQKQGACHQPIGEGRSLSVASRLVERRQAQYASGS